MLEERSDGGSASLPIAFSSSSSFWVHWPFLKLVKAGSTEEAFEIITLLRGNSDAQHPDVQHEYREIMAVVQTEQEPQSTNYIKMLFGIRSGDIHLAQRIQLAFWLQVLVQYVYFQSPFSAPQVSMILNQTGYMRST
jgi:hypothetical protein